MKPMDDELDEYINRPIESSLLDDAVDEYIDAEIDQMAGIKEDAGIAMMLDTEIDTMIESGVLSESLIIGEKECDDHCCKHDHDDDDDDEDDENEDDEDDEESHPVDDDYRSYKELEVDEEDIDEEEEDND